MSALLVDIAALAEELCDPRQHTEIIYDWTPGRNRKATHAHKTIQPGLLHQLADAVHGPYTLDNEDIGSRTMPRSKPPLLIEALSRIVDINIAINLWCHTTQTENRREPSANIRAFVGIAPDLDADLQTALRTDLRRWRTWAAVMTGWEDPPISPHIPCPNPNCATMSSLRISPARKTGYCTECQHIWDDKDGSIGLLAEYIRTETAKPRTTVRIGSTASGHGGWQTRAGGTQ